MQMRNLLETYERMKFYGWEILKLENIIALKSNTNIPLVNYVWGMPNIDNLALIKEFYKEQQFYIITETTIDNLKVEPDITYEMLLNLDLYLPIPRSSDITITIPKSEEELHLWSETAIATFGFKIEDFKESFYPLIKYAGYVPFLGWYKGQPAATSLVYLGKGEAGIYALSTKEEFRRKGMGGAVTNACLLLAKSENLNEAVLYASKQGLHLYNKLGFTLLKTLYEYPIN